MKKVIVFLSFLCSFFPALVFGSEGGSKIPDFHEGVFPLFGGEVSAWNLLFYGSFVIIGTLGISLWLRSRVKKEPAHSSMLEVSEMIWQTCKTYLFQQGKFLLFLFGIVAIPIIVYLGMANFEDGFSFLERIGIVLAFAVIGMSGSYAVAWYGIRINTYANSRTAFASLKGKPWDIVKIPLRSGMSIGLFLISLELIMMVAILLFAPTEITLMCFLGFAIGESLAASALRIAGGIFTKIADIGADLMKKIFKIKEDDPRNPGTIADCVGDNAGDSVGPTADGFETYGVTGVALIAFITLAIHDVDLQIRLIAWIFVMRFLMDLFSGISYFINQKISEIKYSGKKYFDFEKPLTRLIWIAASSCITISFVVSYILLGNLGNGLWIVLASIISCGTLAAALIPELTKIFTSGKSAHVKEIVTASREGGASLNILSGLVAGNFSAFWQGLLMVILMAISFAISKNPSMEFIQYPHIFAFGLIAFGMLSMGPITIAVDSYGPVTDNAQSIFELSQIEKISGIKKEIQRIFGFTPDFEQGKKYLEANDSAGNTFKATAKPVLIGTAVAGTTTMIFSIILLLKEKGMLKIELTDPFVLFGLIIGGCFIYSFSGGTIQAVTTGAYRAVSFIKKNINLEISTASQENSKKVTEVATVYAQKGMLNIFFSCFFITLASVFIDPNFFVSFTIGLTIVGLLQAIYMANAGGAWDNAKKVVEVDLQEKGTELHDATIVGDTVGDPYKDTSSVSINPILKFSSLFGLLGIEIAISLSKESRYTAIHHVLAVIFGVLALYFIWRSFYKMRIPVNKETETEDKTKLELIPISSSPNPAE